VDGRSYSVAAAILRDQGVKQVRLLTNNPLKMSGLEAGGIEVVERVPHEIMPRPENQDYLQTKADKLGHLLRVSRVRPNPLEKSSAVSTPNKT
jgi:3,4-dihydroxy 2-butanone 4-phosphate synthase/GTP cyclohydrolase II